MSCPGRAAFPAGGLLVLGVVVLMLSCRARPVAPTGRARDPRAVTSNIEARDYAGSASCTPCHADIARAFEGSPMHGMTRMIDTAKVVAPFAGESLYLGDDRVTLERRPEGGSRFVRIDAGGTSGPGTPLLYRVTRVLGGHHREDFVGVLVSGYEDPPRGPVGDGDEMVLPVSWLIEGKRLRYKGYSVMVHERARIEAGPVWNRTCPFCHNTVPLVTTLLGALDASVTGHRAPRYQGEVVDALLPVDRAFKYSVRDPARMTEAAGREMARLGEHETPRESLGRTLRRAVDVTRDRFTGSKLLEVGIGCESCHGGSREHVQDPTVRPSLLPMAPYLAVDGPHGVPSPAEAQNHACARCHQVLFSRYPWTWEGGRRESMPGGSQINSGEARDLLLGGCRGTLACTLCHDPHGADDPARLASLATPAGNAVCLGCHGALGSPDALRAHAHHDPAGAGGACVACHMPRKNMSLSGGLTRYHRIGSPTDPMRVLNDRPVECAICHGDKTVAELVGRMEAWWNKAYDRDILRSAYGDLAANVLRATAALGKPHEKATAMALLGERRDRGAAPLFFGELGDPYPLVRDFAVHALQATFGDACDLHLESDPSTRGAQVLGCAQVAGITLTGGLPAPPARVSPDEPAED